MRPLRGKYVLNGSDRPMSPNGWTKDRLDVELAEDWRFHNLRRAHPRRPLRRFPELPCSPCAVIFAPCDPT